MYSAVGPPGAAAGAGSYGAARAGGPGVRSSPYSVQPGGKGGGGKLNGLGEQAEGEPCQFFAKAGWCRFGDQCRYAHIGIPKDREVCQHFEKAGWCKWGDQCRHLHVGGPQQAGGSIAAAADDLFSQLLGEEQPRGRPGEVCQFFEKAGWCKWGDQCKYAHVGGPGPSPRGPPTGEVCQFFAKAGWCKWNDQCRFAHVYEGPPESATGRSPVDLSKIDLSRPRPAGQLALPGPRNSAEVCEFFAKAGWCKWGDSCKYAHSQGAVHSAKPPTLMSGSKTVCKFFQTPGGCRNGEMCQFAHVGTPGGNGQEEVCQFFQKAGWCKWGDQCKYAHVGGPIEPVGRPAGLEKLGQDGLPQGAEVCQFFNKAGWCKWGDQCRFIHISQSPPEGFADGGPGQEAFDELRAALAQHSEAAA